MADIFDSFNSVDPTLNQNQENSENKEGATETVGQVATTENNTAVPPTGTETPPQGTPPVDQFFETFNTRFKTQYKTDEEIKPLFGLPQKITEYEQKLKDRDDLAKRVEQQNRDLENLRITEASKYLSHPLMQKAYIAQQLLAKYPDKDKDLLTEAVMSDVDKMSDLDVVAKERKLRYPQLRDAKAVILHDLGIDSTQDPKEWDSLVTDRLTMMAGDARASIKQLSVGIEFPKIKTAEEVQKEATEALAKRTELAAPHKTQFSQFDKVKVRDDLEYTVPDDFKSTLPNMFDAYFKAGLEPTPENIEILNDIREATFFTAHKDKIYEAMYKDCETKLKKKQDEENGNTAPPNTSTASDALSGQKPSNLPNHEDFLKDNQGSRAKRLK